MNLICSFFVEGPPLPQKLGGHEMISMGYDLIVIGGYTDYHYPSGKLFKLSCSNYVCKWEQLLIELKVPRAHFTAIVITEDFVDCN